MGSGIDRTFKDEEGNGVDVGGRNLSFLSFLSFFLSFFMSGGGGSFFLFFYFSFLFFLRQHSSSSKEGGEGISSFEMEKGRLDEDNPTR